VYSISPYTLSADRARDNHAIHRVGLPPGFVDETLATIDLLIPLTKPDCNGWLVKEIDSWRLDRTVVHRDPPNQSKAFYGYWQDKLMAIEDAFERAKPKNIFQ
jgi:hypothetical protein